METVMESRNEIKKRLQTEQRRLMIKKFFNNKLAVIGGTVTLIMVLLAIFAPLILSLIHISIAALDLLLD